MACDLVFMSSSKCWETSYNSKLLLVQLWFNPLTSNDHYSGRTAPLTSKRCILDIYSTNRGTEYFKHGIYSPFFPLQNAVCFIILTYLVPVLFTFYIRDVLKFKKQFRCQKVKFIKSNVKVNQIIFHIMGFSTDQTLKFHSTESSFSFYSHYKAERGHLETF